MRVGDVKSNLLIGLLAVRLDLLRVDALLPALKDWVEHGRVCSLGECLVAGSHLDASMIQLLEQLAERHIEAHGGEPSWSLASLGPFPGIQGWLLTLEDEELRMAMERLATAPTLPDQGLRDSSIEAVTPENGTHSTVLWNAQEREPDLDMDWDEHEPRYGRYTLLRSIARGGLGEVFVAHDEGLNREVAVKIIQPRMANHPLCLARFLIEAEITGGLEHPGIVPVYALGRCEDGRPFYSMRLIRGESYQEAIARFHAESNRHARSRMLIRLLRHFIDVCNIVAYAHSRGVIHRDIKPSNILLGRYGETMLVDWGLAKSVERPDPVECGCGDVVEPALQPIAGTGVTPTAIGSTVGTPRYMSPEQAGGDIERIGTASDVYNLGATLYCLLAGRDPLDDVEDLAEVLERVRQGRILSPRELRQDASSTLVSISRKAMALTPESRYPSAKALADDIENWLLDLPTTVPERLGRRLGRWEKRNRVLIRVVSSVLLLIAFAELMRRLLF